MVAFSPAALRLLDAAVVRFTDSARRERWSKWEQRHPEIHRRPGVKWDDWGDLALPSDIVEIALLALDRMSTRVQSRLDSGGLTEDEMSELDNELSHIRSVERFLHQAPTKAARMGRVI